MYRKFVKIVHQNKNKMPTNGVCSKSSLKPKKSILKYGKMKANKLHIIQRYLIW